MLGVVGSLSLDLVDGGPARPGGAVLYAAAALRALGEPAAVLAKGTPDAQPEVLEAEWVPTAAATAFSFSYDGDVRRMAVAAVGDPWEPADVAGRLGGVDWLHVGGLLRSDFPAATLAALAGGRVLSLAGHSLMRPARTGPLELDADFDPAVLEHVRMLLLSEEEAALLRVVELGVPEVVVTLASRGSVVYAGGEEERVEIEPVAGVDPTGAGDMFAAGYLAARRKGTAPVAAARRASDLVSELLARR